MTTEPIDPAVIMAEHSTHGASADGMLCASRRYKGRCLPYRLAEALQIAIVDVDRWHDNAMELAAENAALREQIQRVRELYADWSSSSLARFKKYPVPEMIGDLGAALDGDQLKPDSSGQWCTFHNRHQDDPRHRYGPACEVSLRDATSIEEAALRYDQPKPGEPEAVKARTKR